MQFEIFSATFIQLIAMLSSLVSPSPVSKVLSTYRQMLNEGLEPDEYTFNALLTSMARVGASLYAVQDIVGEMNKWNVKVCRFRSLK